MFKNYDEWFEVELFLASIWKVNIGYPPYGGITGCIEKVFNVCILLVVVYVFALLYHSTLTLLAVWYYTVRIKQNATRFNFKFVWYYINAISSMNQSGYYFHPGDRWHSDMDILCQGSEGIFKIGQRHHVRGWEVENIVLHPLSSISILWTLRKSDELGISTNLPKDLLYKCTSFWLQWWAGQRASAGKDLGNGNQGR